MPCILLVDKYGKVKEQKIKKEDDSELYKKAGFKAVTGFEKRHTWDTIIASSSRLCLYGKIDGSAGRENKYDFPPPIDNVLYFGTVVIVKYDENNRIVDLDKAEWEKEYEALFGGFEELDEEDEEEEDEEEGDNKQMLTKHGYLKDNFVVEDEELEYESELSEEEYFD